jgi:hypothetical protein
MVIGNERPEISSQKSNMRRIIFCEMAATNENDPEFEKRLWAEGGDFLSACISEYLRNNPTHGLIAVETDELTDWTDTLEEHLQEAFTEWFKLDEKGAVAPNQMQRILNDHWPRDRKSQREFLKYLERAHGIKKKKIRSGDTWTRFYFGVSVAERKVDYSKSLYPEN